MRISYLFLHAKDLRTSLFIMRTRSFFTLLYIGNIYTRLVYTWYIVAESAGSSYPAGSAVVVTSPPTLEKFPCTRCILCFLCRHLHRRCWDLGIIFLCRRFRCCHQSSVPSSQHRSLCRHTWILFASVVVSDPSDALSILPPPLTPLSSSSITRTSHWKTNYLWVVDFVFCLVTVCTCEWWARWSTLHCFERHHFKQLRCKLNTQRIYEECAILWFKFDLCGLRHRQDREESFESSQSVKYYLPLGSWLRIFSGDSLHLWMLGVLVYLNLFGIETVENS